MLVKRQRFLKFYRPIFDGESDGGNPEGDGDGVLTFKAVRDPATKRLVYKDKDGNPLFTQDHMNTEIGNARKKASEQNKAAIAELERLRDSDSTSKEMRTELEARIDQLTTAHMSEKQRLEHAAKQQKETFEKQLTDTIKEKESWQNRYTNERITGEITSEAVKAGVKSVELFHAFLGSRTKLVANLSEDGKHDGTYRTEVQWEDKDDKGQPVVQNLTIEKAVEQMRALPDRFGPLFGTSQVPGSGSGQTPSKPGNFKSFAEYEAWEKANSPSANTDPRRL